MGNTGSTYSGTRKVHHSRSVKNATQRPENDKTVKGRGGGRRTTTGAQQRKTRRAKKPKSIEEEERIRKEEEENEEFDDSI